MTKKMSLSELSFIVLTDNYSSEFKNEAYQEIQKRFKNNGCNYNAFMEYEEEAIGERGNDIENYLIQPNPDGQLLMELYFNHVYQKSALQHGNLLFSENETSKEKVNGEVNSSEYISKEKALEIIM